MKLLRAILDHRIIIRRCYLYPDLWRVIETDPPDMHAFYRSATGRTRFKAWVALARKERRA